MLVRLISFVLVAAVLLSYGGGASSVAAQVQIPPAQAVNSFYLDPANGMTDDEAVKIALENNGEIQAARKETDAARAMVRQAELRANPKLNVTGARQIKGSDNNQMAEVMVPLELGRRRPARVAVAKRELEARELELANRERLLAADVRMKFGEALTAAWKLNVAENTVTVAKQGYELVASRVAEGKTAPLEANMLLVEYNKLRAARETAEGKAETAYFELRNLIGRRPDEPLRLKGNWANLIAPPPEVVATTDAAIGRRPDLLGAKAVELLADARIEQAKSEGRVDAAVKAGYQRMNTGFPLSGYDDHGVLKPIQDIFHFFTFGIEIDLPVTNRNQGAIEAAVFERDAAGRRREFGELTVRREVAAAIARYGRAARVLSIFKHGVRDTANNNLLVIWQMYLLGARGLQEYIDEQRRCLEAENDELDAQLETYTASVEIMKAASSPDLIKK